MNLADLKKLYGDEYPAVLIRDGVRVPLRRERRFSRSYHSEELKVAHEISRFMDGSAVMTASQLRQEWPSWSEDVRMDFCQACTWLNKQADFPKMLRFITHHSSLDELSSLALDVTSSLPQQEAFDILLHALHAAEPGHGSNFAQAILITKHPSAKPTLWGHLHGVWQQPRLWDDADFNNRLAFEATTCIAHLIELGESSEAFSDKVRQLSEHAVSQNRDSCRNFLSKYYLWLK